MSFDTVQFNQPTTDRPVVVPNVISEYETVVPRSYLLKKTTTFRQIGADEAGHRTVETILSDFQITRNIGHIIKKKSGIKAAESEAGHRTADYLR